MKRFNLAMMGMSCVAVLALTFALTGCYESKVPMKEKADKFAPELLGHWTEAIPEGKEADPLKGHELSDLVIEASGTEGYLVHYRNSLGDMSHFKGHIVTVQETSFLNAQVTEGDADIVGKYFFFRYVIKDGQLELRMVSDRFIKQQFGTSEELYSFIQENLENAKMYEDAVFFGRQSS